MRKDRERKDKAEAAGEPVGEDIDIMDADNDEDEVPSIAV